MIQGVQKFVNRRAPPQPQGEGSPLPASVLHKRQTVAAEMKMKSPSSKVPASPQVKSGNQSMKGIENQSIKTSSSQDSDFRASDRPRGSVQNISNSMAVSGFSKAEVERREDSYRIGPRSPPVTEDEGFGGFPESVLDDDSDNTTGKLRTTGISSFGTHFGPITAARRVVDESNDYERGHDNDDRMFDLPQHPVSQNAQNAVGDVTYLDDDGEISPEDEEVLTRGIEDPSKNMFEPASRTGHHLGPLRGPSVVRTIDRTGRFDPVTIGPLQGLDTGFPQRAIFQSQPGHASSPWDSFTNDGPASSFGNAGNAKKGDVEQIRNVTPPFDGSELGDDETTRDMSPTPRIARHYAGPPQNVGMTRIRRRVTSELDYDAKALGSMNYKDLHNQPFEEDPNPSEPRDDVPLDHDIGNFEDRLQYFTDKENAEQHQFFYQMSLDEWETAGDWFVSQFGQIMNEMKDSRKSRRDEVRKLEDELARRMKEVQDKQDGIEKAMKKMKGEGEKILSDRT